MFDELFTHNSVLLCVVAVIFRPQLSDGKSCGSDLIMLLQRSPHSKRERSVSQGFLVVNLSQ